MSSEKFLEQIQRAEAEADDILAAAEAKAIDIQNNAVKRASAIIDDARLLADEERQKNLAQAETRYREMMQELEQDRKAPPSYLSPDVRDKAVSALAERVVSLFGNN